MTKILSQSGISLADTYDVQGSIAGIENLETENLPIVHEMGATVFSERVTGDVFRITTGVLLQSVDYNVVFSDLPIMPCRLLGVQVFSDTAARLARGAVNIRNNAGREMPVWVWDQTNELAVDFSDNGAAVASHEVLTPAPGFAQLPTMLFGTAQPRLGMSELALRGRTTAFGAGNVTVTALFFIAFPEQQGIPSIGLPIPSW